MPFNSVETPVVVVDAEKLQCYVIQNGAELDTKVEVPETAVHYIKLRTYPVVFIEDIQDAPDDWRDFGYASMLDLRYAEADEDAVRDQFDNAEEDEE